jgi:tRNA threonylcarbamoyladenosine biosynthesis protein TsaE
VGALAKVSGLRAPAFEDQFESERPEQTLELGDALGKLLVPGDFIGLVGELGVGKTQFARGVAQGAGVPASQVASPSFAIIYPYVGRIPIYHADFYRLTDFEELYGTGFTDLVGGDGAVLVEWLDRIPRAAPSELLLLTLRFGDPALPDHRWIKAEAFGWRYVARLQQWQQQSGLAR